MEPASQPKKTWTLRIQRIPVNTTREGLHTNLMSLGEGSVQLRKTLERARIRSLIPKDRKYSCATLVVTTAIPVDELIGAFNSACREFELGYLLDNSFHGVTPLSDAGEDSTCDVIAVPGLSSHALGSWKSPGTNEMWLRDWLPTDVPNIRVLLYGYDSRLQNSESRSSIGTLSQNLLDSLTSFRNATNTMERPIVFLGHSLGGLLIKEALVESLKAPSEHIAKRQLHLACRGMVFFGVPHRGIRQESLQTIVKDKPNEALIQSVVTDKQTQASHYLDRLSRDFAECFDGETRIVSIYETHQSKVLVQMPDKSLKMSEETKLLVPQDSATSIGVTGRWHQKVVPAEANHSDLIKFPSDVDDRYHVTQYHISGLVKESTCRPVKALEAPRTEKDQHKTPVSINQTGHTFTGNNTVGESGTLNVGNGNNQSVSFNFG